MSTLTGSARRKRKISSRKRTALMFRLLVAVIVTATVGFGIYAWRTDLTGKMIIAIVATVWDANNAAHLTVADVTLTGRQNAPLEDLILALDVSRGDPIWRVDSSAARARLEALGWVDTASVARRMPGQITVHITERRPFALWQDDGALFLIDRAGVVITDTGLGHFADLPLVVGGDAAVRAGDLMDMLANQPALFARVRAAVRVGERRWDIHLDNAVTVRLPEIDALAAWRRLARINDAYGIIDRDLLSIDLRLPDRLAVRLNPGAAPLTDIPAEEA
jgi:cell division protein FtsQ